MTAHLLLSWWNLIFVVPFGLALLYLGLYTLSGVTFGETDADTDLDADVDTDADTDVDADADLHADADLDADAHIDADADVDADADTHIDADADAHADADTDSGADVSPGGHAPLHLLAMSFLGVGRVPLSLLLMVLLMTWGAVGFVTNQLLADRWGHAPRAALISIPVAALAAVLFTRALVRAIDRFLPLNETSARRRHELLGSIGEALFPIDARFGLVAVRDDRGELFQVPCRTHDDRDVLPKGARVRLIGYSAKTRSFFVSGAREPAALSDRMIG